MTDEIKVQARRPLDDDNPDGYLESHTDYVLNNIDLAVQLLDSQVASQTDANWAAAWIAGRDAAATEVSRWSIAAAEQIDALPPPQGGHALEQIIQQAVDQECDRIHREIMACLDAAAPLSVRVHEGGAAQEDVLMSLAVTMSKLKDLAMKSQGGRHV